MLVYKCTQLGKIKKMENKDLEESATLNTLLEPVHRYHGIWNLCLGCIGIISRKTLSLAFVHFICLFPSPSLYPH